jgi:hypothetical protein
VESTTASAAVKSAASATAVETATTAAAVAASAVLCRGRTRRANERERQRCSKNHFQKGGTFHLFTLHPTPSELCAHNFWDRRPIQLKYVAPGSYRLDSTRLQLVAAWLTAFQSTAKRAKRYYRTTLNTAGSIKFRLYPGPGNLLQDSRLGRLRIGQTAAQLASAAFSQVDAHQN